MLCETFAASECCSELLLIKCMLEYMTYPDCILFGTTTYVVPEATSTPRGDTSEEAR